MSKPQADPIGVGRSWYHIPGTCHRRSRCDFTKVVESGKGAVSACMYVLRNDLLLRSLFSPLFFNACVLKVLRAANSAVANHKSFWRSLPECSHGILWWA